MRLLLLCGPAFSGKTTLAYALEARGWVRISLDDILRSRGLQPGAGVPERAWQDASFAACLLITSAAQRGLDVVVDDTLGFRSLRDRYRDVGAGAGMSVLLASFEWPSADEPHIALDAAAPLERQLSFLTRSIDEAQKNSSSSV
jgi:predicted kinase